MTEGTRTEWCDIHCWTAHDDDGYCLDCDDQEDPLEDANGYSRSDLLFGGNW